MRRTALSALVPWGLLAVTTVLSAPVTARAQNLCDTDGGVVRPPDFGALVEQFPSDHAVDVPIDGFVRLRYRGIAPRRPYVIVIDMETNSTVEGDASVVPGEVFGEVHWQSRELLRENTTYHVRMADPLGGGAGDNGFIFTTGTRPSSDFPPSFTGIRSVSSVRSGATDLCGEPDAAEVTVTWLRAQDNGWPLSDIEYVVYQIAGPNIGAPVERARERGRIAVTSCGGGSAGEQCLSFRLSAANANGMVCFNVQALDAYGRPDGNTAKRCIDPMQGNTFVGCEARPGSGSQTAHGWRALLAASVLAGGAALAQRLRRRARSA